MTAPVFVDTNVLIYAVDEAHPKKHEAAKLWRSELWKSRRGRISFQVLQEFYANVSQKWPAARQQAQAEVRNLLAWRPVVVDAEVLEQAWKIQDRYQLSFWDALILRSAQASQCSVLWSEDLQNGQRWGNLEVRNPFTG